MARATGIGGVFFRSRDTKALAAWYEKHLGVPGFWTQEAGLTIFSPFEHDTTYFPADKQWMINLRVDDIDAMVADLEAKGVAILGRQDEDYGRFAWILDCDGVKVELWQQLGEAPPAG